ncbi:type I-E CRISPR-associated protein Cas5/CasD [Mangrovactinospora gilvigrisea]|uniref:Type I-E CRISPR-associated protein Cas5/CasD n=1 Tax=Mangrovactinospora gilvigrisea TaxID=1428644 RepID=A0A1J7BI13_9ACTN|nr:type I-E CRISPR-associated protein Cas5/CasD [Mangrovactinospora gilvigrisea]OIV38221.1 type I-E CRISPR-associated protein Cas5/CasD [Mangrovactinospora gilvigrisea]
MNVLVLQLAGPLQSWGSAARFVRRTTEPAPTKSGVLGLLAAAQGRDRDADLSDLTALRFGVRVDQEGTTLRDFQTAHGADDRPFPISQRYYLADAVFVAALEGDAALVEDLDAALYTPGFLPYLGRRSCPPSRPVNLGVRPDRGLEQVLAAEPWHAAEWYQRRRSDEHEIPLAMSVDASPADLAATPAADTVRDHPISFSPRHRRYGLRAVRSTTVTVANPWARPRIRTRTTLPVHDPTTLLDPEEDGI